MNDRQNYFDRVKSGELVCWCTYCNTRLEVWKIGERDQLCCPQCSQIEGGYLSHERGLVLELQDTLRSTKWKIGEVLYLVRAHIKDLAQCKQCSEETLGRVMADPDDIDD